MSEEDSFLAGFDFSEEGVVSGGEGVAEAESRELGKGQEAVSRDIQAQKEARRAKRGTPPKDLVRVSQSPSFGLCLMESIPFPAPENDPLTPPSQEHSPGPQRVPATLDTVTEPSPFTFNQSFAFELPPLSLKLESSPDFKFAAAASSLHVPCVPTQEHPPAAFHPPYLSVPTQELAYRPEDASTPSSGSGPGSGSGSGRGVKRKRVVDNFTGVRAVMGADLQPSCYEAYHKVNQSENVRWHGWRMDDLGRFLTETQAARAVDLMRIRLYGQAVNFPTEDYAEELRRREEISVDYLRWTLSGPRCAVDVSARRRKARAAYTGAEPPATLEILRWWEGRIAIHTAPVIPGVDKWLETVTDDYLTQQQAKREALVDGGTTSAKRAPKPKQFFPFEAEERGAGSGSADEPEVEFIDPDSEFKPEESEEVCDSDGAPRAQRARTRTRRPKQFFSIEISKADGDAQDQEELDLREAIFRSTLEQEEREAGLAEATPASTGLPSAAPVPDSGEAEDPAPRPLSKRFGVKRGSTSVYRGVSYAASTGDWPAYVWDPNGAGPDRGKQQRLSSFGSELEASRAYDRAALVIYGPDQAVQCLNHPLSDYEDELPSLRLMAKDDIISKLRAEGKKSRQEAKRLRGGPTGGGPGQFLALPPAIILSPVQAAGGGGGPEVTEVPLQAHGALEGEVLGGRIVEDLFDELFGPLPDLIPLPLPEPKHWRGPLG